MATPSAFPRPEWWIWAALIVVAGVLGAEAIAFCWGVYLDGMNGPLEGFDEMVFALATIVGLPWAIVLAITAIIGGTVARPAGLRAEVRTVVLSVLGADMVLFGLFSLPFPFPDFYVVFVGVSGIIAAAVFAGLTFMFRRSVLRHEAQVSPS